MIRAIIALLHITGFFGFLLAAMGCALLAVQANFGILDVAPMDMAFGMTSQAFFAYMFSVLAVSCLLIAWGFISTMDKRLGL